MNRTMRTFLALSIALLAWGASAVTRSVSRTRSTSRTTVNRSVSVNRSASRSVSVNRDIDVDVHRGIHPVARTAAAAATVTRAAVATVAAIGSVIYSLPANCVVVVVNGVTYHRCGTVWYQPRFSGTSTTYVVVTAPQ